MIWLGIAIGWFAAMVFCVACFIVAGKYEDHDEI